jgi:hypothetical protein
MSINSYIVLRMIHVTSAAIWEGIQGYPGQRERRAHKGHDVILGCPYVVGFWSVSFRENESLSYEVLPYGYAIYSSSRSRLVYSEYTHTKCLLGSRRNMLLMLSTCGVGGENVFRFVKNGRRATRCYGINSTYVNACWGSRRNILSILSPIRPNTEPRGCIIPLAPNTKHRVVKQKATRTSIGCRTTRPSRRATGIQQNI